jgi:hypothetical protein
MIRQMLKFENVYIQKNQNWKKIETVQIQEDDWIQKLKTFNLKKKLFTFWKK